MASNKKQDNATMLSLSEMYDPANPYALGRKEYNDRYERLTKNAASWRRVAFLMLFLLTVSVSVVLWMAQSVKVVPFVVQVDQHGYQIAVKPVAASEVTEDRVIIARVADFITNMRSLYEDRTATVSLIIKTYDSIEAGSPAQSKLDTYFREDNPLAKRDVITVTLQSVLRAAPESNRLWQAEWSEKIYTNGRPEGERFYKGMFETNISSPERLEDIMRNPLGIFVRDFHITEKLSN